MEWKRLLSAKRLGLLDKEADTFGPRSPFQRDYDRILFSSAFRRLQDKTQVFPLAKSDYVRTRLTHSLEVSSVGRSLGVMVGDFILSEYEELRDIGITSADFGTIVATASLAHDIGNPPFGHAGEDAIQEWFKKGAGAKFLDMHNVDDICGADFTKFEGNAQGFRVLTRLQSATQEGGMQLTCAVLGAFTKYPRPSLIDESITGGISGKKFGFIQDDQTAFESLASELGLRRKGSQAAWFRHPLAFLVEAADDICYGIMDIEDGFRSGHLTFTEVRALFEAVLDNAAMSKADEMGSEKHRVEYLRAKAINEAITQVVEVFKQKEKNLLDGSFDTELMAVISSSAQFKQFKTVARDKVYTAMPVVEIEACGYTVLAGLLDSFLEAVDDAARNGKSMSSKSSVILKLMPENICREGMEPVQRILAVTDAVSGMTDSYALRTYQHIYGISLP